MPLLCLSAWERTVSPPHISSHTDQKVLRIKTILEGDYTAPASYTSLRVSKEDEADDPCVLDMRNRDLRIAFLCENAASSFVMMA